MKPTRTCVADRAPPPAAVLGGWPFFAKLPARPPGDHRIAADIEMSARHCDGLAADPRRELPEQPITRVGVRPIKILPWDARRRV